MEKKTKLPTAKKRDIRNNKRRLINKAFKSKIRTTVRGFEESVSAKEAETIKARLQDIYSVMDKAAKRGLYNQRKVARLKSRFSQKAKAAIA
jgi:small subunit ribosomal protein S20